MQKRNLTALYKLGITPVILIITCFNINLLAQPAPATDENIPYLVTFGKDSDTTWGDDDFCQIFFVKIPDSRIEPVYIRIFDPVTGSSIDEPKGVFNTAVKFSVYGGKYCWSNNDSRNIDPVGNFKSGILLGAKTFKNELQFNKKWYTFGPINPYEGEYVEKFNGKVFKIIAEGISGDDGNLYSYFLSSSPNENYAIEGGNFFTYEYTFRMPNDQKQTSQIYPYIDNKTTSLKIFNYDWDNDGSINVISVAKNGERCSISGEGDWKINKFNITEEEKNSSLEVQFVKNQTTLIKNNNVVIIVQNQYDVSLPFYVIPIGGRPVYKPKISMIGAD